MNNPEWFLIGFATGVIVMTFVGGLLIRKFCNPLPNNVKVMTTEEHNRATTYY